MRQGACLSYKENMENVHPLHIWNPPSILKAVHRQYPVNPPLEFERTTGYMRACTAGVPPCTSSPLPHGVPVPGKQLPPPPMKTGICLSKFSNRFTNIGVARNVNGPNLAEPY